MDLKSPMAGKTLNFSGEIVSVREATEKELKEGLHGERVHQCHCGGGHEGGCGDGSCGDGGCCGEGGCGEGDCCGNGHDGGCGCSH